jgi:hypothetical protein
MLTEISDPLLRSQKLHVVFESLMFESLNAMHNMPLEDFTKEDDKSPAGVEIIFKQKEHI